MKKRMKKGKYSKPRNLATKLSELASEKKTLAGDVRHFLSGKAWLLDCVSGCRSRSRRRQRVGGDRRESAEETGREGRGEP